MDISRQSQDRIEDFMSMTQTEQTERALFVKIATNLKNPYLFKGFMTDAEGDPSRMVDYAYAAGLISRAEADYLKRMINEHNGNDENDESGGNDGNNENGGGVL